MNIGILGISLIVVIFLLIASTSLLLYAYLRRSRSIRMLKDSEQIRSSIFTKITHEFRTPLTIITGLSRQLRNQDLSDNNARTYLNSIERQGKVLSELVNQLLDITNLRTATKALEYNTGNIVTFINMISETFRIYAKQKDIDLFFYSEESEIETNFVPNYLNKIMHNLIGNAIKFSDEGTRIYIIMERSKKDKKKLIIKVVDNGRGISKEILPNIFDLFFQSNNNSEMSGNGIGLTLTKQLVEIVGGTINVESELGKGTTFILEFPIQINENIIYPRWSYNKDDKLLSASQNEATDSQMFSTKINENDPRTTMLLVEDNKDLALFIRSIFSENSYNILYASNGESALKMANKYIPDIIITDIIMPKKNGNDLCKDIKASPLLNHIPVIIISAKNRDEDVIEGFKSGADNYLIKPFQPEELKIRVTNILNSRNLLKEKYHRTILKENKKEEEHKDENANVEFLRHLTDIIYREMKNPDFTPSRLAQELAISVSQLNKKLNTITGHPSSSYILKVKLSHAKKLLTTQNITVGEVAAECGIFDVNYFSRVFKKQTGLTPTQFRRLPLEKTSN